MGHWVKNLLAVQETQVWSLGQEDPLEKEMATHSSILAWRIPWTEEPGRLQCMGSQRVRHDWATITHSFQRREILVFWTDAPSNYIYSSLFLFLTPNLCYSPPFSIPDWIGSETGIEDLLWVKNCTEWGSHQDHFWVSLSEPVEYRVWPNDI